MNEISKNRTNENENKKIEDDSEDSEEDEEGEEGNSIKNGLEEDNLLLSLTVGLNINLNIFSQRSDQSNPPDLLTMENFNSKSLTLGSSSSEDTNSPINDWIWGETQKVVHINKKIDYNNSKKQNNQTFTTMNNYIRNKNINSNGDSLGYSDDNSTDEDDNVNKEEYDYGNGKNNQINNKRNENHQLNKDTSIIHNNNSKDRDKDNNNTLNLKNATNQMSFLLNPLPDYGSKSLDEKSLSLITFNEMSSDISSPKKKMSSYSIDKNISNKKQQEICHSPLINRNQNNNNNEIKILKKN